MSRKKTAAAWASLLDLPVGCSQSRQTCRSASLLPDFAERSWRRPRWLGYCAHLEEWATPSVTEHTFIEMGNKQAIYWPLVNAEVSLYLGTPLACSYWLQRSWWWGNLWHHTGRPVTCAGLHLQLQPWQCPEGFQNRELGVLSLNFN